MQTMPLRLRHEERISNSPEVLAAASIQPQNSGLVAYAPRVSEDLLAGGPALREAFASAPFHIAQRCKMLVSASDREPPVLRVVSQGLRLAPKRRGSVVGTMPNSGALVRPTKMNPASRRRRTT